jgi:hypothetical protein
MAAMRDRATPASLLVLAASIGLAILLIAPRLRYPIGFDGLHSYLPMARRLLAEGLGFLQHPDSVMVAPFAFIYPALLGANEMAVRSANVGLFALTIALAFFTIQLAHSSRAAALGAALIAVSPTVRPFIADVMTEPPFMFLMAAWMLAVARLADAASRRPLLWVVIGAVAFGLASLTRPAVAYFAPAMALVFAWRAWRSGGEARRIEIRLAALHAIAFGIGTAWAMHNAAYFNLPSIATGAGAALWLGLNPMVYGYDPNYFGLTYDVGAVARDMSHLTLEADRILRGTALVELQDTPLSVTLETFIRKTFAFVFVSSTENSPQDLALLRTWRIAMVVLAAAALLLRWRTTVVWVLGALIAYMLAVHAPALYSHRYSVGAIDIPLSMLAAIGAVECSKNAARLGVVAAAAAIGIGAGLAQIVQGGPGSPRIDRGPVELIWSGEIGAMKALSLENARRDGATRFSLAPGAAIEVPVTDAPKFQPWDASILVMDMALTPLPGRQGCTALRLRYRKPAEAGFSPERVTRIPLESDGRMRKLVVGTVTPLRINHEGVLRIEFECAFPASLEMGTISFVAPRRALIYRERYLRQLESAATGTR